MRFVLGSASQGRLRVLRGAGVDPMVIVSGVDEEAIRAEVPDDAPPGVVTTALAVAKAQAVAAVLADEVRADCVVVGCDSMLELNGELCGKPGTPDAALTQWQAMAGRSGHLHTGHCVLRVVDGSVVGRESASSSTTLHFADPSPRVIEAYVATGEPLGVAGAFTLDGLGGWFVDRIEGDPSNVIGLSLPLLRVMLSRMGVQVTDVWAGTRTI